MYDAKIKGGKGENDIMLTVMSAVLSALAKEGLKEENIDAVVGFITKSGMKIGSKVMEYLEKKKQGSAEEGIPDEVQKEVEESVRELMEEQARPVYMGGVAFMFEQRMEEDIKEDLKNILTNINAEEPASGDDENQDIVDRFMWDNYGRLLCENEQDYYIGDDCLYLNLSFDDLDDYYRIYDDKGIRMLADALNHLLGDRYITRFVTY